MRRFESKDFGNANHLAKIGKVGRRKEEVGSVKCNAIKISFKKMKETFTIKNNLWIESVLINGTALLLLSLPKP